MANGEVSSRSSAQAIHWREEGPTMVTVSQRGPIVGRLFGVPFLLIGLYLLSHLVNGIWDADLTIAGWTLLPLFTAAFLVPGWILVTGRKRTRLDRVAREAVEEIDYLVYTRRTTTKVPANATVLLRTERLGSRSDSGSDVFAIHVYLTAANGSLVLLALLRDDEKSEALAFATKPAAFFGIEIDDACRDGGDVTAEGVVVAPGVE